MYIYIYYFWCNIYNSILNSPKSTIVKTLFFNGNKNPKSFILVSSSFCIHLGRERERRDETERRRERNTIFTTKTNEDSCNTNPTLHHLFIGRKFLVLSHLYILTLFCCCLTILSLFLSISYLAKLQGMRIYNYIIIIFTVLITFINIYFRFIF